MTTFFRRPVRIGAFAVLAITLANACGAYADTVRFAPAGQEFSIQFPPDPQLTTSSTDGEILLMWQAKDNGFLYLAIHSTNPAPYDPVGEPAKDVENFVKETQATVTEQHRVNWPTPSGSASGLMYSFRMPNGMLGQGLYTVIGNRGFSAGIIDMTDAGRQSAMAAFINSLTILK